MTNVTIGTTTATTALVPVFTGTLQGQTVQLCDARALHAFMVVLRDFSNWIKARIRKFGFVEGVDYLLTAGEVFAKSGENLGGRPPVEYHLTLDMAKELSMVENNEKGREIRRYFMACEKRALEMMIAPALPTVITPAQCQHLRELVQLVVESGKQTYGETWTRLHRKMQVNSYLALKPEQFNAACEYLRGKMDGESIAAIAQKHFPQVAQLAAPIKEQPSMEEKQMSLDVKTLCAMITGGLLDKQSLYRIGDAAGMMMYIDACSNEKGWGDAVAAQIDGTTSAQDLQAILKAATLETWHRARGANKPAKEVPQRSDYRMAA